MNKHFSNSNNDPLVAAATEVLNENITATDNTFVILKDNTLAFIDKSINQTQTIVWVPRGWGSKEVKTETLNKSIKAVVGKVSSVYGP